jgi:hypothetical protein
MMPTSLRVGPRRGPGGASCDASGGAADCDVVDPSHPPRARRLNVLRFFQGAIGRGVDTGRTVPARHAGSVEARFPNPVVSIVPSQ